MKKVCAGFLPTDVRSWRGLDTSHVTRAESAAHEAGIHEMTSPKVGTRPPSTLRIAQCEPEAKDLPLSGVGAALPRHRFPECGRKWRPRASWRHHNFPGWTLCSCHECLAP